MTKLQKEIIQLFALVIIVSLLPACSVVTKSYQVDAVIENHLPPFAEIEIVSGYELKKRHGRNINGVMITKGNLIKTYKIESINDPIVVLHEICHILEPDFHKGYSHSGLQGCKSFNYDTLANL